MSLRIKQYFISIKVPCYCLDGKKSKIFLLKKKNIEVTFFSFLIFPPLFLETKHNNHTISLTFFVKKQSTHTLYTNDSKINKTKTKKPYTLWGPIDPLSTICIGKGWTYGPISSSRIREYPRTNSRGRSEKYTLGRGKEYICRT